MSIIRVFRNIKQGTGTEGIRQRVIQFAKVIKFLTKKKKKKTKHNRISKATIFILGVASKYSNQYIHLGNEQRSKLPVFKLLVFR